MMSFQPTRARAGWMGQAAPVPVPVPAPAPAPVVPAPVATVPASVSTEYTGFPGFLETIFVLGAAGAGAYVGIKTATNKKEKKNVRIAGWVGGIGAGLLGLLYLGTKTGVTQTVMLPQVRVTQ